MDFFIKSSLLLALIAVVVDYRIVMFSKRKQIKSLEYDIYQLEKQLENMEEHVEKRGLKISKLVDENRDLQNNLNAWIPVTEFLSQIQTKEGDSISAPGKCLRILIHKK